MGRYVVMRLLGLIGVLLAVSLITFFLMHAIPGGPFDAIGGDKAAPLPAELRTQLNALYGLDKPLWVQYVSFLRAAVRLDFGYSFYSTGRTVIEMYKTHWPHTVHLGLMTLAFGGTIGLALGLAGAIRQGTWIDSLGMGVSIFCMVMPSFVLAVLLQFVFSIQLKLLPTSGWDSPKQWILPVMANSLGPILILHRFTRASMADAMRSNYVRTARAKGMSERRVMLVHVFRNALTPIVTVAGPMFASLMIGSFFVESMFRIPGIGMYTVKAIGDRDYPLIMANTLLWTTLISVAYLVTDLIYALIDPRVTFVKEK